MIKIFNLHIRIWIRKPKYPHPESEHYMVTVSSPDSDKVLKYLSRFLEDKIAIKKEKQFIRWSFVSAVLVCSLRRGGCFCCSLRIFLRGLKRNNMF